MYGATQDGATDASIKWRAESPTFIYHYLTLFALICVVGVKWELCEDLEQKLYLLK